MAVLPNCHKARRGGGGDEPARYAADSDRVKQDRVGYPTIHTFPVSDLLWLSLLAHAFHMPVNCVFGLTLNSIIGKAGFAMSRIGQ